MQAVQAMTGHGGWPMTVFLTPDGVPFYGGTYFPTRRPPRHAVVHAHSHGGVGRVSLETGGRRARRSTRCADVRRHHTSRWPANRSRATSARRRVPHAEPSRSTRSTADSAARRSFRRRCRSSSCCRHWARRGPPRTRWRWRRAPSRRWRAAASTTSSAAASRATRSTRVWLVPHFEKMLYDNALLVRLGAHLWQATHDRRREARRRGDDRLGGARDARAGRRILLVARRRQRRPRGQVLRLERSGVRRGILGDDAPIARAYWGVTDDGNFEGKNILSVVTPPTIAARVKISDRRVDRAARSSRAQGGAVRRARRARVARSRRQGARVVERPHGARHRRGCARIRRRTTTARSPSRSPSSCSIAMVRRRPRDALVQGRPRAHRGIPRGSRRARPRGAQRVRAHVRRRVARARALSERWSTWFWDDGDRRILRHGVAITKR